jgi:tetrahydromethanopterin S-methyltransferase subunit A
VKVKVDEDKCSGCGICADICPEGIYELRTTSERVLAVPVGEEKCSRCRACKEKCPQGAIEITEEIRKVKPPGDYPPEDGHYLRGNDYSPVAVIALLNSPYGDIPSSIESIVRSAIESGAALAGTLQTANIGIEKIIANIVANPNIRYLLLCGNDVEGHMPGMTIKALIDEGLDNGRRIRGSKALNPYLLNITTEAVERFRKQVAIIDLTGVEDTDAVTKAIWSCYQEKPTVFRNYKLYDIGAYSEAPICRKVRWRVTRFDLLNEDDLRILIGELNKENP